MLILWPYSKLQIRRHMKWMKHPLWTNSQMMKGSCHKGWWCPLQNIQGWGIEQLRRGREPLNYYVEEQVIKILHLMHTSSSFCLCIIFTAGQDKYGKGLKYKKRAHCVISFGLKGVLMSVILCHQIYILRSHTSKTLTTNSLIFQCMPCCKNTNSYMNTIDAGNREKYGFLYNKKLHARLNKSIRA